MGPNTTLNDYFKELTFELKYSPRPITDFNRLPEIKEVIFSGPATIVFWDDNTKTVVKCQDGEPDRMVGFAMAMCKKALGNKGNFNNVFKKFVEDYE